MINSPKKILSTGLLLFLSIASNAAPSPPVAPESPISFLINNNMLVLFTILMLGLSLGKIKIWGFSAGLSGVLFAAIIFGHLGFSIPQGIGKLGLILFAYCIGITAGPSFFSAFAEKGKDLAKLSIVTVATGAVATIIIASILNISPSLATGLFAGALTSTPGLAAGIEAVKGNSNLVSVGYGIAYPFGVIGVIIFIHIIPKITGKPLEDDPASKSTDSMIVRKLIEVTNPDIFGSLMNRLIDSDHLRNCKISRLLQGDDFTPIQSDFIFMSGQKVLVIGEQKDLEKASQFIGRFSDSDASFKIEDNSRCEVTVGSPELIGKTLKELNLLSKFGITVSMINLNGIKFIANTSCHLEHGDTLTVVGFPNDLNKFVQYAGNASKILHATDLISMTLGIALGIIIGLIPISIPGLKTFSLGMAGGPLFIALIFGYFRKLGKIRGYMPAASRMLLMDLGVIFFLTSAGIKAGSKIVPMLKTHGFELILAGTAITVLPLIISFVTAKYFFKMDILESLGGICGGMTSTPSLGTLVSKTDSKIPINSYATAYPVALILMTIAAQIVASILS